MLTIIYIILGIVLFFMGASIFSFLNVVAYRAPKGISFIKGRSFCPNCNHALTMLDMIPVLGHVLLKGNCRYCHKRISIRYPMVELLGGIFALGTVGIYGFSGRGACVFLLLMLLMVISLIDWDTMEIYNQMNLMVLVLGGVSFWFFPEVTLAQRGIGFFCGSLPMLLVTLAVSGAFGGGDIKLMAASGVFLGWKHNLVALFLAILVGGIYGSWLLLSGKKERKDHFAFGPFLCVGIAIAALFGDALLKWYAGFLYF